MKKLITFLALILFSLGAAAQGISDAEMQKRKKTAEQLMELLKMEDQFEEAISMTMQAQIQQNPQLEQFRPVMEEFFRKYFSYQNLKEPLTGIYAEAFTEKELLDLIQFYKTPTGQKAASIQSSLMQKGMLVGQQEVQKHLPELQQMIMTHMQQQGKDQ